ncbi:hypothetical protein [Kitasatospora sp. NPDC090091]|uniref:hypothetical protein n=1 Tax=Kitasatospora sp. NPDC090091 TaxID=3364081 RepID=UPI003806425C
MHAAMTGPVLSAAYNVAQTVQQLTNDNRTFTHLAIGANSDTDEWDLRYTALRGHQGRRFTNLLAGDDNRQHAAAMRLWAAIDAAGVTPTRWRNMLYIPLTAPGTHSLTKIPQPFIALYREAARRRDVVDVVAAPATWADDEELWARCRDNRLDTLLFDAVDRFSARQAAATILAR